MSKNTTHYQIAGETTSDKVLLIIGPSLGIIISICSLMVLNTYLDKLNKTIKCLFYILLIHNFINFTIAIVIVLYVIFSDDQSPELCYLHYQTSIPANNVSFESIGILSVVRYYIAWKTQNNETPKEKLIIGTTILIFCLEHIVHYPLAYLATEYFDLPSLVTMCNSETLQGSFEVVGKYYARFQKDAN